MWERFVQERVYLKGISPATVRYYKNVHSAFQTILPEPTQAGLVECIKTLRERGVKASSINTWLRGLKAYQLWRKEQGCEVFKVQFLKTETKVLATLSEGDISRLVKWSVPKPSSCNLRRAHLVALTILDCGFRASEVLGLSKEDCDFDNLIFKVLGKGSKHRLVPFSVELRKALFRYVQNRAGRILFGTKNNTKLSVRNLERDFSQLGQKLGITGVRFSPHTLRHTFAVGYLRKGGNLFYLSKILGHTSVKTTERYLQSLGIEDLQAVHSGLTPLSVRV
jgi:integrase/recombinase XerD